jgi:hypothetical protein
MMTFFSTPELLELDSMLFTSPNFRPTRVEAIEYYRGVARKGELNLSLGNRVHGASQNGDGAFTVRTEKGEYRGRFTSSSPAPSLRGARRGRSSSRTGGSMRGSSSAR